MSEDKPKLNVLVVSSNLDPLKRLMDTLRELGYDTSVAGTPTVAMATILESKVDVVICEWQVGSQLGLDLCRAVRKKQGNKNYTYFILLAELDRDREQYQLARNAGVDDFLPKPPDIGRIWMRLQSAGKILGYMAHVRELKGYVPICAYCNKIRDDQDYWQSLEGYLASNMKADIELRVCPECAEEHGVEPEGWES